MNKDTINKTQNLLIVILLIVVVILIIKLAVKNNISDTSKADTIELKNGRVYILQEEMIYERDITDIVEYTIEKKESKYYLMARYKEDKVEVMELTRKQVDDISKQVGVGYILDFNLLK